MYSELPDPPSPAEFPFAGWVPTANGRLSFRHVGESRNPTESRYANVTTDSTRLVVAYQHRPLSDALFQWLIHPLQHLDGSFYFVLTARSEETPGHTEELFGTISIYKSHLDWRAFGRPAIRERVRDINLLVHSFVPNRDALTEALFEDCERELAQTADIEIKYRLFRTGEVYFENPSFKDSVLAQESNEYAAAQGQDFNKWIADQSYFFLRDITHTHQHHAPSSDTMLMLHYRDDPTEEDDTDGDIGWRRNIVYSLNHHIIRAKRFADSISLFQAMGVLAYCKSFKGICTERFEMGIPGLPQFNDDALLDSLRARVDERMALATQEATNAQIQISRAANWRLFVLAFITLVIAMMAIVVTPFISANKTLESVGQFCSENLLTIVMILFFLLLFVWALTQNSWQVKYQIGRDLLEFSNVRRTMFIGIYFALAVVILVLTARISEPAIANMEATAKAIWKLLF